MKMRRVIAVAVALWLFVALAYGSETTTLVWDEPIKNSDGSVLTFESDPVSPWDFKGYYVLYGKVSGAYGDPIPVSRPVSCNTFPSVGKCTYIVSGLEVGTWYFAIKADNVFGNKSEASNEISRVITATSTVIPKTTWTLRYEIQIDLGSIYNINGFRYLPRQDGEINGRIGQYEFYVSIDGSAWGNAVATGTFANNASEKEVLFTSKAGRYVRLRALTEVNGNAEINVLGNLVMTPDAPVLISE